MTAEEVFDDKLFSDLEQFHDRDGVLHAFVSFKSPSRIICWGAKNTNECGGGKTAICKWISVLRIKKDELENLGVWDKLSSDVQDKIEHWEENHKEEIAQKMENARLMIGGRHDACVVPRAVVAVESMVAVTLCDFARRAGLIPGVLK